MRSSALLLAAVACGSGAQESAAVPDSLPGVDSAPAEVQLPGPVRGRLVARAVGPQAMGGSWRARVRTCDASRSLQIVTQGDSVDVLVLVFLADTSAPEGEYPVLGPDRVLAGGEDRHARIGVQRLGPLVASYQGSRGTVSLERVSRTVSGRFDVVLREAIKWDTLHVQGHFTDLPVEAASPEVCGDAPQG